MQRIILRRFEKRLLQNDIAGQAQVPAAFVRVDVYRQGATIANQTIIPADTPTIVPVYNCGRIAVNDTLQYGAVAQAFNVTAVDPGGSSITVRTSVAFTAERGGRFIPINSPPTVYNDPAGQWPAFGVQTDANGYAEFYCAHDRFDVITDVVRVAGGSASLVFTDCEGGWSRGQVGWVNARDYPSIQAAIDSLPPEGGVVYIPSGTYTLTETLYTPCDRPCHLLGDGTNSTPLTPATVGTVLEWTTMVGMIRLRGDSSSIRHLVMRNTSSGVPAFEHEGYGIAIGRRDVADAHPAPNTTATTEYLAGNSLPGTPFAIEDVVIEDAPGWGLYVAGVGKTSDEMNDEWYAMAPGNGEGGTISFAVELKRVRVKKSKKFGACFTGLGCNDLRFVGCAFLWEGFGQVPGDNYYVYVSGTAKAVFDHCNFEGISPAGKPWVKLWGAVNPEFNGCWFEEDAPALAEPAYFLKFANKCRGGVVQACQFVRGTNSGGKLRFLQLDVDGARGLSIINPYGISADPTTLSNGSFIETTHVDLGGSSNKDIDVMGSGVYLDETATTPDKVFGIQYAGVPREGTIRGRLTSNIVGVGTQADLTGFPASNNGNMALVWDLAGDGSAIGGVVYSWGGAFPGWRLTNNLPTMTTTQRDGRSEWVQGDMIYNSDVDALQVRVGSAWRSVGLAT